MSRSIGRLRYRCVNAKKDAFRGKKGTGTVYKSVVLEKGSFGAALAPGLYLLARLGLGLEEFS